MSCRLLEGDELEVDAIKRRSNGVGYGRRFDIELVILASCDGEEI